MPSERSSPALAPPGAGCSRARGGTAERLEAGAAAAAAAAPGTISPTAPSATRRAARCPAAAAPTGAAFIYRRLLERAPPPALPAGHVLTTEARPGRPRGGRGADSITWLGHACFLIRLQRSHSAHRPLPHRAAPRRSPGSAPSASPAPGLPPELLPPIDVLLLSHNHYDHLDLRALDRLQGRVGPRW